MGTGLIGAKGLRFSPVTCRVCGTTYEDLDPGDCRAHAERCQRWQRAVLALGRAPRWYDEREDGKRAGHRLALDERASLEERASGVEMVLLAQFDRSLEAAIFSGYWEEHPVFERYAAMRDLSGFPSVVAEVLRRRYGPRLSGIGDGRSYWEPRGASASPHPSLSRDEATTRGGA